MSLIFYVMGVSLSAFGLLWIAAGAEGFFSAFAPEASGLQMMAATSVLVPGFALFTSGLFMLATGEALRRLAQIVRNTRRAPQSKAPAFAGDTSKWSRTDRGAASGEGA